MYYILDIFHDMILQCIPHIMGGVTSSTRSSGSGACARSAGCTLLRCWVHLLVTSRAPEAVVVSPAINGHFRNRLIGGTYHI